MSPEVNGVPSCQTLLGRIFQVVSMRPSGKTFHKPFSSEGTASARRGCRRPWSSAMAKPECSASKTVSTPSPPSAASELRLSVGGLLKMAAVTRLGAADWTASCGAAPPTVVEGGGAQLEANKQAITL